MLFQSSPVQSSPVQSSPKYPANFHVIFKGKGQITVDPTVFCKKPVYITVGEGTTVSIGPRCKLFGNTELYFKDNCVCEIGADVILIDTRIVCGSNARVSIGDNTSINDNSTLFCRSGHEIRIGQDCMLSQEVVIHSGDAHPIYNTRERKVINFFPQGDPRCRVVLKDHVWVGLGMMLLQKTEVGCGSIIGARSLVKDHFPNNVIIAGSPARIKRRDVGWKRYDNCITPESYMGCTQG